MKKIASIVKLATQFAEVQRTTGYRKGHLENDAEHCFQLALVCWSANHQYKLGLNDELILKFALAHDLVELYAGDTDAHDTEENLMSKEEREKESLKQLKKEYEKYNEILSYIDRYEEKKDDEAKLVHLLDKLIPEINIYNANGNYYKSRKITIEKWKEWLHKKIDYNSLPEKLQQLMDESIKIEVEQYSSIFYKDK